MSRLSRIIFAAAFVAPLVAAASFAQGQGPDGFSQFREKHKYTFQLMSMVRHIGEINKDPKYTLTQTQAKQVLAVLEPLRKKPKLTQDQAKEALKALKKPFTVKQLNAMARIKPLGPMGQRPPVQGRPGPMSGPAQTNRPRFDPDAMKDFNPFYVRVKPGDEFAARRARYWDEFFTSLQNKARGVKSAPPKTARPAPTKKAK